MRNQLGDRLEAVIGFLDGLDAVRHAVHQIVQVGRTAVERGSGEEIGRVIKRGINPVAGG